MITVDGKDLLVVPPSYPSHEVKEVLGGRWDREAKAWRVAPTSLNVLMLGEWYGPEFVASAPKQVQNLFRLDWGFEGFSSHDDLRQNAEAHPMWETLYPFQRVAVEYLVCNPHMGALLALSPGLGKTPVSIVALDVLQCERVLILAPLTLAKNWGKEIEKWSARALEWTRSTAKSKDPSSAVVITNFETVMETVLRDEDGQVLDVDWATNARKVKAWREEGPKKMHPTTGKFVPARERIVQARRSYSEIDWDLIIVDESVLLKNRKAVKVDVIQQLAKYTKQVWLLSGSPTAQFQDDLYPQMKTIMPRAFASYWRFAEFFCLVERGQWGWTIEGDRPNINAPHYLRDLMLVMNQKDVLPDLPDYIYNPIEIDLNPNQAKAIQQMTDDWVVALKDDDEPELEATMHLAQVTRLQQITSNLVNLEKGAGKTMPNSSAKEDLLVDLIAKGDIEFPLLVWTWYVPTAHSIEQRLAKEFPNLGVLSVVGEDSAEDKDGKIDAYKAGDVDVLILQMTVGKFGHTFTDTKTVYYHDRSFDSDAYLQSLRRVKRIGLEHRPRLIVPRAQLSSDPLVELNLSGKMQSISKVAKHDLMELLRSLGGVAWSMNTPEEG